jgi:hypothetical protein
VPSHYLCPRAEDVEHVLTAIVGTRVTAAPSRHEVMDDDAPSVLAEFVADSDAVGALCHVEHRVAISLSGALVRVAPQAALAAIDGYKLDDESIENVREVVNVMAQLFNSDFTPHLRFKDMHRQPGKLPEGTNELRRSPLAVRQYKVSVDNYGSGILSFLLG